MRTVQAIFSATVIALLAIAGLHNEVAIAWKLAIVTAALAFFTEELHSWASTYVWAYYLGNGAALLSWFTGAIAGVSLLIYA